MSPRKTIRSEGNISRKLLGVVRRQEPPHLTLPFASGIYVMTLAGQPHDCPCIWVPLWGGEPGSYRAIGWRLKFSHCWCPHRAHKETRWPESSET